jgi:hypothetical protein
LASFDLIFEFCAIAQIEESVHGELWRLHVAEPTIQLEVFDLLQVPLLIRRLPFL